MKTSFFANLALSAAILFTGSAAWAKPMKVELNSSTVIREVSMSWGDAYLNLERGVVKVTVGNLPKNSVTGQYEPVTLTDRSTRPATAKVAEGYQAWLLRVEDAGEGNLMIMEGYDLGILDIGQKGRGFLKYDGHEDLSNHGFNVIAVTATENYDDARWAPECPLIDAMRWNHSPTGVIVLWNSFGSDR
jgi:hypothetical protein